MVILVKSKLYGVKKVDGKCVLYKKKRIIKAKTKSTRKTPKNLVVDFPKDIKVSITNPRTNERITDDYVEIKKTAYPSARARKEVVEEKPIVESKVEKFIEAEKRAEFEELKKRAKEKQEEMDKRAKEKQEDEAYRKEMKEIVKKEAEKMKEFVKKETEKLEKMEEIVKKETEKLEKPPEYVGRPMKIRGKDGHLMSKSTSSKEQQGEGKNPSVHPDAGKAIADEYKEQIFNELPEPIRNLPIEKVVNNINYYMHNPYTYDYTNPHIELKAQLKKIKDAEIYGKIMDIHGANQHRRERPRLIEEELDIPTDVAKIINSYDEYKQEGQGKSGIRPSVDPILGRVIADIQINKIRRVLPVYMRDAPIDEIQGYLNEMQHFLHVPLNSAINYATHMDLHERDQLEKERPKIIEDEGNLPTNIARIVNSYTQESKEEEKQEGQGLDTGLDNHEITKLMKDYPQFLGVVASDRVDSLQLKRLSKRATDINNPPSKGAEAFRNPSFIMNLDKAGMKGSHWIACYIDKDNEKEINYYDPLGDPATDDFMVRIKKLVDRMKLPHLLKFKWNNVKNQTTGMNCGLHSAQFLKDRYAGKSFKDATGYIEAEIIDNSAEKEQGIDEFKKEIIEFGLI